MLQNSINSMFYIKLLKEGMNKHILYQSVEIENKLTPNPFFPVRNSTQPPKSYLFSNQPVRPPGHDDTAD